MGAIFAMLTAITISLSFTSYSDVKRIDSSVFEESYSETQRETVEKYAKDDFDF